MLLNKIDGSYSVSFGIFVGAGSSNETLAENGISHFIEHVTFKGTKKRTSFDISNDIEMMGADINAYTTRNMTCYYVKSTVEHTKDAFDVLSDIFLNSTYDVEELEKEKGVIVQEINMYDDTPDDLCADLLLEAYFGKQGYGARILGSKKRVESFTKSDILNYKRKYYTTDNIVVSVCGGFDENEIISLVNDYFGGLEKSVMAKKPLINTSNLGGSIAKSKNIAQTHIALGFETVGLSDDNLDAFSVLTYVLGGGMSSRLFQSVREKSGLCYSVYSYATAFADCGFGMVCAGVDPKNLGASLEAIMTEMTKLKKDKISDEEFTRSREQMKSGLVFAQESVSSQMQIHAKRLLLSGEVLDFGERLNRVNKMKKSDVNGLIDRLFNINNLSKAVVGKGVKPL